MSIESLGGETAGRRGEHELGSSCRGSRPADSYFVRRDSLGEVVGSEAIARELLQTGLLVPVVERHRLTIYRRCDIARACEQWARLQEATAR